MRLIKAILILVLVLWGAAGTLSLAGGLRMTQDAASAMGDSGLGQGAGNLVSAYHQIRDRTLSLIDLPLPTITGDLTGAALVLLLAMGWWRARRLTKHSWTYSDAYRRTYRELEIALKSEWEKTDQNAWGSFERFRLVREGRMRARAEQAARDLIISQSPLTRSGMRLAGFLKSIVFLLPTLTMRGQGSSRLKIGSYAPKDLAWHLAQDLKLRKRPATGTAHVLLWLNRQIERLGGHLVSLAVIALLFGAVWGLDRVYALLVDTPAS